MNRHPHWQMLGAAVLASDNNARAAQPARDLFGKPTFPKRKHSEEPAGDYFEARGVKQANIVVAATRILWRDRAGVPNPIDSLSSPSNEALFALYLSNPALQAGTKAAQIVHFLIEPRIAIWLFVKFCRLDENLAHQLFNGLDDRSSLDPKNPRFHLRRLLHLNHGRRKKLSNEQLAALFVLCWNAMRDGRHVRSLKLAHAPLTGLPEIR
jgi:hypothetical protein